MRNNLTNLFIVIIFLFSSCVEENELSKDNNYDTSEISFDYAIDDGLLIFETESDYAKAIDCLVRLETENNIHYFDDMLNYESYRSVYKNNEYKMQIVQDELFASIINAECMFGVGKYIFKLDFIDENINVFTNEDCELKSRGVTDLIGRFSFNDDVFSILNGEAQLKASYCSGNSDCKYDDFTSDAGDIKVKLVYVKLGVYNTVLAKISQNGLHKVNIGLGGDFEYVNRKGSGSSSISLSESSNSLKWRPYSKMKRLKDYKARVFFSWDCSDPHECLGGITLINECDEDCATE